MSSLQPIDVARPPRLARSVCLQALALAAAALLGDAPWSHQPRPVTVPEQAPRKEERRIRVVQVPRPRPPQPASSPPRQVLAQPPPAPAPQRSAPEARARIAADSTAVQGVRLRVLVPRSPGDLAAHLRNSGGCLVVSRLSGGGAEVLSVLGLEGERAVELTGPPCSGVPRLLRDPGLNQALGDPLGRARAALPGAERNEDLVLQVLLTPRLHDLAQYALRARFGVIPAEQMARQAAEAGYELTCFAEPAGSVRCQ